MFTPWLSLSGFYLPSECLGSNTGNVTDVKRQRLDLSVLSLGIWRRSQHCRVPQVANKMLLLQIKCSFHRSERHEDYAWAHVTTARTLYFEASWSILEQPEIRHALSVSRIWARCILILLSILLVKWQSLYLYISTRNISTRQGNLGFKILKQSSTQLGCCDVPTVKCGFIDRAHWYL